MKAAGIFIGFWMLTGVVLAGTYSGGNGQAGSPYLLGNADDIEELRITPGDWNSRFLMTDDIDLSGTVYTEALFGPDSATDTSYVGTKFTGVFDGDGHEITGLTIHGVADGDFLGLFGYLYGAEVKNLGVVDVEILGAGTAENVGALAGGGYYYVDVVNCWSSGTVTGWNSTGGLIGHSWHNDNEIVDCRSSAVVVGLAGSEGVGGVVGYSYGIVRDCCGTGGVSGENVDRMGGAVGYAQNGSFVGCCARGDVTSTGNGSKIGGFVGSSYSTLIEKCHATGDVSGDASVSNCVGGLAGRVFYRSVKDCYATGRVSGNRWLGGLLGDIQFSEAYRCYATGEVVGSGSYRGGLIGNTNGAEITGCFWDVETSGMTDGVGDTIPDPAGVEGKTTAEMQTASTYVGAGWNMMGVWTIEEDQTYPLLRKYLAADTNYDGMVDLVDFSAFAACWLDGVE